MKIILFDIETFPAVVETWGTRMYEENVIRVLKPWELASFAYKELGKQQVHCFTREGQATDKPLIKKLWRVLNTADVVIAHNGDKFDIKKSNTRIIKADLLPYAPNKTIDTLKIAKKHFAFTSNRLDDLADFLGVGRKLRTGGYSLWEDCRANKASAWRTMERYNKQDVRLLERVYLKLRPWAQPHPNLAERGELQCTTCKSEHVTKRGFYRNLAAIYQRYKCDNCGKWLRGQQPIKSFPKQLLVGAK